MSMQQSTRLFMAAMMLIVTMPVRSQAVYSKIVFAQYEAELPGKMKNNFVQVLSYTEISSQGLISFVGKDYKTGEMVRTSYKLGETELQKLNTVFNGKNSLKKEIVDTNQVKGRSYGSNYDYCAVKYLNGKKDELCYMLTNISLDFSDILDMIDDIYYNKTTAAKGSAEIPSYLYADILKLHKKSTYLPTAGGPPPPMEQ